MDGAVSWRAWHTVDAGLAGVGESTPRGGGCRRGWASVSDSLCDDTMMHNTMMAARRHARPYHERYCCTFSTVPQSIRPLHHGCKRKSQIGPSAPGWVRVGGTTGETTNNGSGMACWRLSMAHRTRPRTSSPHPRR